MANTNPYLIFSSPNSFTLATANSTKNWNGILEYSTNSTLTWWNTWNGTTTLNAIKVGSEYLLYLRGTGNTVISGGIGKGWTLTGSNISCSGNIENLLDYESVKTGEHPSIGENCYNELFSNCTSLTTAPELPATTLAYGCYKAMFENCTSLTTAPELPATVLSIDCYFIMFRGCTNLTTPPELPATTLASRCYAEMFENCTNLTMAPELPAMVLSAHCYDSMFWGCTSLTTPPELPATTLAKYCYEYMFRGCTSLITAPELPATTLAEYCYDSMFYNCTSLITAPELSVTTLARGCYRYMFHGCTNLITAPELPATTLARSCYYEMFSGCTNLTMPPELPATTLANYCYKNMFKGCMSLSIVPELPATILAESCYDGMFYNCTGIKLSATKTNEYGILYRVPSSGDGTDASNALLSMFYSTGGTFTGTPTINTTYYLYGTPKYVDSINLRGSVKYLKHSNLANDLNTASSNSIPTVKAIRDYREFTAEQYNAIANLLNLSSSSDTVSYITPTNDVIVDIEIDEKLLNVTHKEIINDIAMVVNNNELVTSSTTREFLSLTNEQYDTLMHIING